MVMGVCYAFCQKAFDSLSMDYVIVKIVSRINNHPVINSH